MDSVAILKVAAVAYYLLIRLEGLLYLQSARRPVGRERVLAVLMTSTTPGLSCFDDRGSSATMRSEARDSLERA